MDVAIQVPAFQEGEDMLPTLESINEQNVPSYVGRLSKEVWVTPDPPDRELCTTWQAALRANDFEPFEAPQYKLSARNDAHDSAMERGYDVIATWDADAPALSDDAMASLLEPFRDPSVAAVRGNPRSPWTLFGTLENVVRAGVARPVFNHIHGQLSAFTADAWRCAGPFDTNIDQTALDEVWDEEEVDFAARLRECGEMVHADGAMVFNDSRRTMCRFRRAFNFADRPMSGWCGERGEKTFEPKDGEDEDWGY